MTHRIRSTTALLAIVFLAAADKPGEEATKMDMKKLEGTWNMVAGEKEGQQAPEDFAKNFKLTFADEKVTATEKENKSEGTFKLEAAKKPKTIDFTFGPRKMKGIYLLEGDNLKICHGLPGVEQYPTDFTTKAGSQSALMVFRREPAK